MWVSVKNSDKILKQTPLFLLCTLRTRLNRAHAYIHQTDLKKTPACILALVYSVAATLPAARHQKHTTCHCYSQNQCSTRAMTMSSSPRRHFINALLSGGLMTTSPLFLRQPMSRPHPKATMPSERSEKANSSLSRPVCNERERQALAGSVTKRSCSADSHQTALRTFH